MAESAPGAAPTTRSHSLVAKTAASAKSASATFRPSRKTDSLFAFASTSHAMCVQSFAGMATSVPLTARRVAPSDSTTSAPPPNVRTRPGPTGSYSAARKAPFTQKPTVAPVLAEPGIRFAAVAVEFVAAR